MAAFEGRRLVVWRHGETGHNAAGRWQGQLDTELSDTGRSQALRAAAVLAAYRPSAIWSSDLARAADTARALSEALGLPIRYDARLREIHVGQWQGRQGDEIRAEYPEQQEALSRGEDVRRGIDGETVAEVAERSRAALDELLATLPPGRTAVVATHGVSGRAAVASLVGIDQGLAWTALAGWDNCHWAELREDPRGWRIWGWNLGADPLS